MMNQWETQFAKRLSKLHEACGMQFDQMFIAEIMPAFETISSFVATGGMVATVAEGCHEVRGFKFTLAKDQSLDVIFTLQGPCEVESAFRLISLHGADDSVLLETVPLSNMTEGWARKQFENALDEFIEQAEKMMGLSPQATEAA